MLDLSLGNTCIDLRRSVFADDNTELSDRCECALLANLNNELTYQCAVLSLIPFPGSLLSLTLLKQRLV